MQAVFALAFLAVANAAIIEPSIYYKPEGKIFNPLNRLSVQHDFPYNIENVNEAVISAPVSEAVISSGTPAIAPVSFTKTAFPWSNIYPKSASVIPSNIALEDAYAPALKNGLAYAIPAVKSSAYHLVKADYPYFTAAPTSSYVEAAAPVVTAEEFAARGLFPAVSASLAAAEPALKTFAPLVASSAAYPSIPLFKSAAFPWVSSVAAPSSLIPAVKSASYLAADSAFAPAVHSINAAPISFLKSAPASFANGLYSAENALTTPFSFVKAFSPASGLFEEPALSFAPHAHVHAFAPALKGALPFTSASLAYAPLSDYASPAAGYFADSPALKTWIK